MATMTRDVHVGLHAAVCEEAELQGSISFGAQVIVHPNATVVALAAPVTIGDRSILEDHVRIEHADATQLVENSAVVMQIGSDNLFESGCVIRSTSIGNGNWFEPKAETHAGSVIGNNCLIGSGVVIARNEVIPDNTIVVCIQDAADRTTRHVTRAQKEYLLKARETLTQKYVDTFLDTKSPYALAKNHRLLPVVPQA